MAKKSERKAGGAADDARLWQAVTQRVAPLKRKRPAAAQLSEPAPGAGPEPAKKTEKPKPPPAPAKAARPEPAPKLSELPALIPGAAAGLDKRTAQRLRRGRLAVEARLDLHGLTQAEAHRRLDAFLAAAHETGLRCVLVITGKGRVSEAGGVLRRMVPRWLNAPPNRGRVIAIAEAQPKDGGSGALYVLVRRKR